MADIDNNITGAETTAPAVVDTTPAPAPAPKRAARKTAKPADVKPEIAADSEPTAASEKPARKTVKASRHGDGGWLIDGEAYSDLEARRKLDFHQELDGSYTVKATP